jgi:hypothetical protein
LTRRPALPITVAVPYQKAYIGFTSSTRNPWEYEASGLCEIGAVEADEPFVSQSWGRVKAQYR